MKNTLFLIGAGFNNDAKQEAGKITGHSIYNGEYEIQCGYPLLNDLRRICFDKEIVEEGNSIEERFATALKEKDYKPLRRLYDTLMEADYYLIPKLLPHGDNPNNCYAKFFDHYNGASFLTFNYDSLVEIFLLRMGRWCPRDGYGVPVEVEIESGVRTNDPNWKSSSLVLHLHGSLCIYKSEFDVTPMPSTHIQRLSLKEKPDYIFDPESISSLFFPFSGSPLRIADYDPVEFRVIAPVPDKAEGFRQQFIKDIHCRARQLISRTGQIIAIGYDFSPYDASLYRHLLIELANCERPRALIVSPRAKDIEKRLSGDYRRIDWHSVGMTFKSWVDAGFPE